MLYLYNEEVSALTEVHQNDFRSEVIRLGAADDLDQVFSTFKDVLSYPYSDKVGLGQLHSLEHCIADWLYMNWGRKTSVIVLGWDKLTAKHPYVAQDILIVFESAMNRAAQNAALIHLEPQDQEEFGIIETSLADNRKLFKAYFVI